MSKSHIDHLIPQYILGKLKPAQLEKIKSHLLFCSPCRKILAETEKAVDKIGSKESTNSAAKIEENVVAKLRRDIASDYALKDFPIPFKLPKFITWRLVTIAVSLLIAIIVIQFLPHFLSFSNSGDNAPIPAKLIPPAIEQVQIEETPVMPEKVLEKAPEKVKQPLKTVQKEVPPKTVWMGSSSGIEDEKQAVISDQKSWQNIWSKHVSQITPTPEVPIIDFNNHNVIVIFAGTQKSGGYNLEILEIKNTEWEGNPAQLIKYRLKTPPNDALFSLALTQPFIMKRVNKFGGETFFDKRP